MLEDIGFQSLIELGSKSQDAFGPCSASTWPSNETCLKTRAPTAPSRFFRGGAAACPKPREPKSKEGPPHYSQPNYETKEPQQIIFVEPRGRVEAHPWEHYSSTNQAFARLQQVAVGLAGVPTQCAENTPPSMRQEAGRHLSRTRCTSRSSDAPSTRTRT